MRGPDVSSSVPWKLKLQRPLFLKCKLILIELTFIFFTHKYFVPHFRVIGWKLSLLSVSDLIMPSNKILILRHMRNFYRKSKWESIISYQSYITYIFLTFNRLILLNRYFKYSQLMMEICLRVETVSRYVYINGLHFPHDSKKSYVMNHYFGKQYFSENI